MNLTAVTHSRQKWAGIRHISNRWRFPEEYSSAYIQNQGWVLTIFLCLLVFHFQAEVIDLTVLKSLNHGCNDKWNIPAFWAAGCWLDLFRPFTWWFKVLRSGQWPWKTVNYCTCCVVTTSREHDSVILTNPERADWGAPALSWAWWHVPPFIPH